MQYRLNYIGCGQLGKTLGSLWHKAGAVVIGDVLTRTPSSADLSAKAIGSGNPINHMSQMRSANIYLIACADDAIESCSQQLAESGLLRKSDIVFHCSGAQSSQ